MRAADLASLNAERAARRPVVLVSDLASGRQRVVTAALAASDPLAEFIAQRIRLGTSGMVRDGECDHFLTVYMPPVRLLAVGAVHISQALAPLARLAGFDVTILDPRTAFATPERFPDTTIVAEWPDDALPAFHLDRYTAVALLTHDPRIDDQALIAALQAECFYLGALGSRKTHGRRLERMRERGMSEDDLVRIHAPIGLDIGAVSPAEIALAIVAEIVAAQRKKPARTGAERGA